MKKRAIKIIVAFILFVAAMVINVSNVWINNILYIISYLIVGYDIVLKAIRNIFRGKIFDENFLKNPLRVLSAEDFHAINILDIP